jgi:type I restriction enzyme, S subunit
VSGGWPIASIGESCAVFSGGTPSKGNQAYWRGAIPWVSAKDLKSDRIFDAELHISKAACEGSAAKVAPLGSLLILVRGMGLANGVPIGEVTSPVAFNQDIRAIVPPENVVPRFLALALRNSMNNGGGKHLLSSAAHGTLKIDADALRGVTYPVAPLAEQRRIVAILDKAFEGIATARASAEKNLQNARELFAVQRDALFADGRKDWPSKPLGDVAEVQSGGTPLVSSKAFWGGEIAWYSSGELNRMTTSAPERHITDAGLANSNAKLFPKGSLLVGMYDTAALKMSVLDRAAAFNQAIAGVKPNGALEPEFLLHSINVKKEAILSQRRGVRQKNLSLGKIKEIVVPVPRIAEQRDVIHRLRDAQNLTDRLRVIYERKFAALGELKTALLHHAFTGAL